MLDKPEPKPDIDAAVAFLEALRPAGPWNVTAIVPDGPITSATFTDADKARAWIAKRADHANLHFVPNPAPLPSGKAGRVRKTDVPVIGYLHADLDVDKLAADHELAALPLPQRKIAVEDDMAFSGLTPTLLVDSGGGLQGLWRLAEPLPATPENIAWAEGANRWLAGQFAGGEPECANIDHLLRLPGTINHPNEKKRKRGRTVAPTKLVSSTGELHARATFGHMASAAVVDTSIVLGAPEAVTDLNALASEYGLSPKLTATIEHGHDPDDPDRLPSRSEWVFSVVNQLLRRDVRPEQVMGVLLNPDWGISASVLDQTSRAPEDAAEHHVRRALATMEGEKQSDLDMMAQHPVDPDDFPDEEAIQTPQPVADIKAWLDQNFIRIGDRDLAALPPTKWILEGVVIAEEVSIFGGRGGVGKSLLAWMVAIMIATGRTFTWWPAPKRARRVLVISGEDSADEIEKRVAVACVAHGIDRCALGDRFLVKSDRDIKLAIMDTKKGTISRTELWANIREAIRTHDVGLVIVDPVIKSSLGFNESDNSDMNAFFECLRELVVGQEAGVLVVDHFAKGGVGGDQGSVRGASAKIDAARMAGTVTAMTEKEERTIKPPKPRKHYVLFSDAKTNYAEKVGGQWFELVSYEVGNGERRPALVWRPFDKMDGAFDPQLWPQRSALLALVAAGRDGEKQTGWPWSAARTGAKDARLDIVVSERFGVSVEQAQNLIAAFAAEGSIEEIDWHTPTRNKVRCWQVNPYYQTEEDSEILELRNL